MRHVFLSYSHQDNDFAQLLRTELQNAGIPTWLALENIKPGEDWKGEIDDAIKNSFALIVIISPESDQSKYVTYEWALACGFGIPIIPILYKPLESPQKPHPRLESLQYEDFTTNRNRPWPRIIKRLNEIQAEYLRKEQRDPKIEEAIQALDHWDSATIVRATEMLGKRKAQSAISKLDRLLDDADSVIQNAAIKALGEIGSSKEIDKIASLVDKDETRFSAIESLGKIGDIKAEAVLLRSINSVDNQVVKILCINALKNMQSPALKEVLLGFLQEKSPNWEEEWEDEQILKGIFQALADRVTKDDVPRLIEMLNIGYPDITVGIIQLLGELRDENSLPHILKLARNDTQSVSKAANLAIEKFEAVADFQKNLKQLSSSNKAEHEDPIIFFYQHFRLEGLFYVLAQRQTEVFWNAVSKIKEVVKDSDDYSLIEALRDSDSRVRGGVAEVIRLKQVVKACSTLRPLVDDETSFVRGLAIRAIGDLRCAKSITLLKSKLKDTSRVFGKSPTQVRDFAAIALAKLKSRDALPRLKELTFNIQSDLQEEATDLFISLGGNAESKQLESALYGSDSGRRIAAFKILCYKEKKINVNELTETLKSQDSKKRADSINQLSELYTPLGLIVALTIAHGQTRWEIAEKLAKVLQPEHSSFVVQLLSNNDYGDRAFLAEALGLRPDLNLGEYLFQLTEDKSSFVRGLSIRALGRLKSEAAKERLLAHLDDEEKIYSNDDARVCDYSAIALVSLEGRIPVKVLDNLRVNPTYISQELMQMNQSSPLMVEDEFVNELSQMLLIPEITENLGSSIVDLMGEFGSAKDAHTLLDYLASGHGEGFHVGRIVSKLADRSLKSRALSLLDTQNIGLQMVCLDVLEMHGDSTVISKVLSLLNKEENDYIVFRAIKVLAAHGDESLLDKISSFKDSKEDSVRGSVVKAYGKLRDGDSLTRILPFLDDENYAVRAEAVQSLIEIGDPNNLEIILEKVNFFHSETRDYFVANFHLSCVKAISKFGDSEYIPVLRDISLKHEDSDCRVAAIYALKDLNDEKIVDILIDKLSDEENAYDYEDKVCNIAARILSDIEGKKAKNALKKWLSKLPEDERTDFTKN